MLKKLRSFSIASMAFLLVSSISVPAQASLSSDGFTISRHNSWRFTEDPEYAYSKGSPSQFLSLRESVLHHSLSMKVNTNLVDSFVFRVGCMVESPTPLFELKVNSLDIRLFDAVNDYAYARFLVDKNQEYSLRGEIVGRNRIIFAPITKAQERGLSDLFLQLREGSELKIGLLQGKSGKARIYKVPLAGFIEYSDKLIQSCQNYNKYARSPQKYLPDYMAKEPEGYAPKDYSLVEKDDETEVVDPNAITEVKKEEVVVVEKPVVKPKEEKPEILPFTPGGGPVSIGPDGLPIGTSDMGNGAKSGDEVEKAIGTAKPMSIGADGLPINNDAAANQASDAAKAGEDNQENKEESSSFLDIF